MSTTEPGQAAPAVAQREDIIRAYELVLGRAPDPNGLAYFISLAQSQQLNPNAIAKLLIASDEFKASNGGLHDPVKVEMDGYCVFVRNSDRDIGGAIAKGIVYEPHVTALIDRELRMGDTFLDVGANIGFFTMRAASRVGASGKVIAVEPMDKNLQLIYLGVRENNFENVVVWPFGASDHDGLVSIVTDACTSNALVQSAPSSRNVSIHAPVRTLDWMCQDLGRLDFIKIDIEGHEMFAWRGASRLLARFKPRIATEFHPHAMKHNSGLDYREYLAFLFQYSPRVAVLLGPDNVVACKTQEEVMVLWEQSDTRHGGNGTSHLDLFLDPQM